jgi:predicted nucleic acid-binding protein
MKNVTISMDDATLRWVRVEAAKAGMSVSRWIAAQLGRGRELDRERAAASARIEKFLADFPGLPLSENGKITIDRDELYDDGRFRRFDHPDLPAGSDGGDEEGGVRGVAEDP